MTRASSPTPTPSTWTGRTRGSTSRSAAGSHICPGAALARTEARISLGQLLDRTTDIWIDEDFHGPAGDRKYQYIPTFILRGLSNLHIGFTTA